jgi:hypothetical protein
MRRKASRVWAPMSPMSPAGRPGYGEVRADPDRPGIVDGRFEIGFRRDKDAVGRHSAKLVRPERFRHPIW